MVIDVSMASKRSSLLAWRQIKSALLVGMVLLGGFCYGFVSHRNEIFPFRQISNFYMTVLSTKNKAEPSHGRWGTVRHPLQAGGKNDADQTTTLGALGYLAGYEPAPSQTGVIVHHTERAYPGYNYYASGHDTEAFLTDMQGDVLHSWRKPFAEVWPDRDPAAGRADSWFRVFLYDNGDLLAIYDKLGLVKLDKYSNVVWSYDGLCHHNLQVMDDGRIYVLSYEPVEDVSYRCGRAVYEDFIDILSPDGIRQHRVSVLRAFADSPFHSVLEQMPVSPDPLHTNSLQVLDGRFEHLSPAFKAGNVLISERNLDIVAVVDMEKETVAWVMTGMWRMQHEPRLLDNGRILLFDNQGHDGFSKIIEFNPFKQAPVKSDPYKEFDPLQQEVVWMYPGDAANGFHSRVLGSNMRLPNGNTLITQSENGRAFEVTPANDIVWEFLNPHRAGDNNELIAVIYEMVRIGLDFPLDWRN